MIDTALVLKLKYICGDREREEDINADVFLIQTLTESGLVKESRIMDYDRIKQQFPQWDIGEAIIDYCCMYKVDIIIFMPSGIHWIDPPRHCFDILTNKMGIKTIMIRGDSFGDIGRRFTDSWFPFMSNIAFIDGSVKNIGYSRHPKAIQSCLSAGQASRFDDKKIDKDVDVCFIGNTRMPRREEYLKYFKDNGITIHIQGGQSPGDKIINWEEYIAILNRSKISLNFCLNGCGASQIKGRVIETMACNTFLLEDEGTETNQFFDEGIDFVMANSKEDMLNKINYYLEHDEEREQIAASGYRKIIELYNARNAWGHIFEEMGFPIDIDDESYKWFRRKMEELKR